MFDSKKNMKEKKMSYKQLYITELVQKYGVEYVKKKYSNFIRANNLILAQKDVSDTSEIMKESTNEANISLQAKVDIEAETKRLIDALTQYGNRLRELDDSLVKNSLVKKCGQFKRYFVKVVNSINKKEQARNAPISLDDNKIAELRKKANKKKAWNYLFEPNSHGLWECQCGRVYKTKGARSNHMKHRHCHLYENYKKQRDIREQETRKSRKSKKQVRKVLKM